jgi:erythromycin esterase-like protein
VNALHRVASAVSTSHGFEPVLDLTRDARFVLLGESSHGTDEFYQARAHISRALVTEQGFDAVVLEADWPSAARVDRYVRGLGSDASAAAALSGFTRFPRWMWQNAPFAELVDDLRAHNASRPAHEQVRVFGMDLYSLEESRDRVVAYLDAHDPMAARQARSAYACFGAGVVRALERLHRAGRDGAFTALGDARVVQNAEGYYRIAAGLEAGASSWNRRDRHMIDTLTAIEDHLSKQRRHPRLIVWAHNSHLGDARATEMSLRGEHNVGQLARERWGDAVVNVGFTTYHGQVRAAPTWNGSDRAYDINPGRPDSIEHLLHEVSKARGLPAFVLVLEDAAADVREALPPLLQRAIGVIYRPDTERQSHYFEASLADQFDAVIHFDRTRAVEPVGSARRHAGTLQRPTALRATSGRPAA